MYLFIINKGAGNGNGAVYWRQMEKRLVEKEMTFKAIISGSEEGTHQLIDRFVVDYSIKAIAVIGGDGTIRSVLQKSIHYQIPLAIFPTGSGNDTARMFKLTNDPKLFIDRIIDHNITAIDLLRVNNHYGVTVVGAGIDAVIGKTVNESFYKPLLSRVKLGSLSYLIAVFQAALYFKPFKATITIDQRKEVFNRTWLAACGNTMSYGGGLKICPNANPTDGYLHSTIFHTLPRLQAMLRIFPTLLRGKPVKKTGITYDIGQEILIETDRPIDVILDGEIITTTPLTVQIHKQALQLIHT